MAETDRQEWYVIEYCRADEVQDDEWYESSDHADSEASARELLRQRCLLMSGEFVYRIGKRTLISEVVE